MFLKNLLKLEHHLLYVLFLVIGRDDDHTVRFHNLNGLKYSKGKVRHFFWKNDAHIRFYYYFCANFSIQDVYD